MLACRRRLVSLALPYRRLVHGWPDTPVRYAITPRERLYIRVDAFLYVGFFL
ncbi:hypothetical protein B0G82_7486 [Paraburkholderia sp. BL17N1]|nr:hypothetical protein B0G82_7486 [Paraburkholderia sp. BL17N1]